MSLAHFPPDPRYGCGIYRRRICLSRHDDHVLATMTDTHHSMWLLLRTCDEEVTAIDAAIERGPANSCDRSPAGLCAVVGTQLAAGPRQLGARLPPSSNCTHLSDLLRWAMRTALSGQEFSEYLISITDQTADPMCGEIRLNGVLLHRWLVDGETIVGPEALLARPLLKGFFAWASSCFDEEALQAAVMLQRGFWVARGRRHIVDESPTPLSAASGMRNACFSYSGGQWETATNNVGYVRDFSHALPPRATPAAAQSILEQRGVITSARHLSTVRADELF